VLRSTSVAYHSMIQTFISSIAKTCLFHRRLRQWSKLLPTLILRPKWHTAEAQLWAFGIVYMTNRQKTEVLGHWYLILNGGVVPHVSRGCVCGQKETNRVSRSLSSVKDVNILRPTHFLKTNFLLRYGYTGLGLAT